MKRRPLVSLCKAQQLYGSTSQVSFMRPRYVEDGFCEWCGKKITEKRRTSCCSKECSYNFNVATSSVYYANIGSRGGYGNHILRRDNYTCQKCGEFCGEINEHGIKLPTTNGKLDVHHKTQVQHGGDDHPDNLITLCFNCHKEIHRKGEIK